MSSWQAAYLEDSAAFDREEEAEGEEERMGAFGNPGSRDSHVRKAKKSTKQKKEELKLRRRRKRELEEKQRTNIDRMKEAVEDGMA